MEKGNQAHIKAVQVEDFICLSAEAWAVKAQTFQVTIDVSQYVECLWPSVFR